MEVKTQQQQQPWRSRRAAAEQRGARDEDEDQNGNVACSAEDQEHGVDDDGEDNERTRCSNIMVSLWSTALLAVQRCTVLRRRCRGRCTPFFPPTIRKSWFTVIFMCVETFCFMSVCLLQDPEYVD